MRPGRLAAFGVVVLLLVGAGWAGKHFWLDRDPTPRDPVTARETPPSGPTYPVPKDALFVAPTGQDVWPGNAQRPLKTVAAAVRKVRAGGTIVLRAGTYREALGKVEKRLTIQPYPHEQVWIKGSVVVAGWRKDGNAWRKDGWAPNICRDCFLPNIISGSAPLAGQPDQVFVDGTSLPQVADAKQLKPGTFRVDPATRTLWLGSDPTGKVIESSTLDRFIQFEPGSEGSVLQGLGIGQYASNQDYGKRGAMVVVNAAKVTLREDVFVSSASSGVIVFKPDVTVERSTLSHNGLVGLAANRAHRIRLIGNTVEDNNIEKFSLTGDAVGAAGIKLARTANAYVADNVFRDNYGTGWWCDLGCSDATVVRNLAQGNAVNGLYYEVSSRALIASNVLQGNKRGVKVSGADRVRIWSNTFVGNGIALGVYGDPRPVTFDAYSASLRQPWRPVGLQVQNNLFASADDANEPYIVTEEQQPYRTNAGQMLSTLDGNVYVRDPAGMPAALITWWTGPTNISEYRTVTDLSGATGRESGGAEGIATPAEMFTDLDAGDYTLKPAAPGYRKGVPLPADVAKAVGAGATAGTPIDVGVIRSPRR